MAQQVMVLATTPDNLSLIHRTHMVRRGEQLPQFVV